MTNISQEDVIRSVADSLQFISYYHPADYIAALGAAYAAGGRRQQDFLDLLVRDEGKGRDGDDEQR